MASDNEPVLRDRASLTGPFGRYPLGHPAGKLLCCSEIGLREGHEREVGAVKMLNPNAHLHRSTLILVGNPELDQRNPKL